MSTRLSRSEREKIIINYLKGISTPGYEVKECSNEKYLVKQVAVVEVEEEDVNEQPQEEIVQEDIVQEEPPPTVDHSKRSIKKQNARELLEQLSQMLSDSDDEKVDMTYYQPRSDNTTWTRRRLRF